MEPRLDLMSVVSNIPHYIINIVCIALILLSTGAPAAQQSVTDGVYVACNVAQFNSNDTFAHNFNAVAQSLIHNSSKTLYSTALSESGSSSSNYVYGIYQCRGDVSLSDCSSCVSNFVSRIQTSTGGCGYSARGARAQYQGCYVRYEDYTFYSGFEKDGDLSPLTSCSHSNDSSPVYQHNLATALNNTASAAPKHALFGYNASSVGTLGSSTAYALSQCMGYLSPSECATCLSKVSNYSGECNISVSAGVYFNNCYYQYANASFLFTYNNSTSTANPPASPQRSPIAASPTQERSKNHSNTTPVIVGIVVGTSLAIAVIITLALCYLKRRKTASNYKLAQGPLDNIYGAGDELLPQPGGGATRFSLKELREATADFHPRNKLGEGGFGPVYQGRLNSGREVAIKMLSAQSRQGKTQFLNEVNLITTVQHRNLIQLIGCCVEDSKSLLVYEYLPNRSLDLHLFDVSEKDSLDWNTRFEIILGIARGLAYLHEDSQLRIVHRDIKAGNILLDNNLEPKIADFGLARLFGDDMTHLTTRVVGTLGYLSPEYAIGGQLSEKVDVYSFGLVALEIVSGRKVIDNMLEADKHNLLDWTWSLYEKKQQVQIVDKRMQEEGSGMDVNVGEVFRVVHVALLCTQTQPHLRPSMSEVYNILCSQSNILELPTKPITFGMLPSLALSSSTMPSSISQSSQVVSSYNEEPISELEPR